MKVLNSPARRFALAILLFLVLVTQYPATVCAQNTQLGVTDEEIVIGSCSAVSGPSARTGTLGLAGADAYFSYINSKGGVYGRKIKLNRYDDRYTREGAEPAFKQLLKDNCFAGLYFGGAEPTSVYLPLLEKNKVPVIGFYTGSEVMYKPFHKYAFNVRATYGDELKTQIDRLWKDLGPKSYAMIHQVITGGSGIVPAVNAALASHDAKVVADESFPYGTVDVGNAVSKLRDLDPDVVIIGGPVRQVSAVIKHAHSIGFYPLFIATSLVSPEDLVQSAGADAEHTLLLQVMPPFSRNDLASVGLYKKVLNKYLPNEKPNLLGMEGFMDAMVLVEGLKRAGKDLTRDKLVAALESMNNVDVGLGPKMRLLFSPERHQGLHAAYTSQIRSGEAVVYFNAKQIKLPKAPVK